MACPGGGGLWGLKPPARVGQKKKKKKKERKKEKRERKKDAFGRNCSKQSAFTAHDDPIGPSYKTSSRPLS